jgi:hypothetical protein
VRRTDCTRRCRPTRSEGCNPKIFKKGNSGGSRYCASRSGINITKSKRDHLLAHYEPRHKRMHFQMRDMHHIFHSTAKRAAFKPRSSKPSLDKNRYRLLPISKQGLPGDSRLFFKLFRNSLSQHHDFQYSYKVVERSHCAVRNT